MTNLYVIKNCWGGVVKVEEKLIELWTTNGYKISTIVLLIILFLLFTNTDKILLIKSEFFNLFSKSSAFAKKRQISNKVRGTILKSAKEQSLLDNDVIPSDMKVVWINEEKPDTFVKNNQVIVRIKQSSNPHEDLITAVSEYVNSGLLHNVKRYLNEDVMDASRVLMTRKVIQNASKNSLDYLDENYIIPKINSDSEFKDLYSDLVKIDHNGMFVHILLNEFKKAGMSIYGEIPDSELIAESKEFMHHLYRIAARISSETSDLCFNRDYFKVAIFLTASTITLKRYGIIPFIKAADKQLSDGIQTLYIFGLGSKREIAEQISNELDSDFRIGQIIKHSYKHINENGRRVPGVLYECEIFKDDTDKDT